MELMAVRVTDDGPLTFGDEPFVVQLSLCDSPPELLGRGRIDLEGDACTRDIGLVDISTSDRVSGCGRADSQLQTGHVQILT